MKIQIIDSVILRRYASSRLPRNLMQNDELEKKWRELHKTGVNRGLADVLLSDWLVTAAPHS